MFRPDASDFTGGIPANAKILGVTFSLDLHWNVHVDNIISKAGKRIYLLSQLKRASIDQGDLLIGDTHGG